MIVYLLLIVYILFMILKILLSNSTRKKKKRLVQMIRGIILIVFIFFAQLNNTMKNNFFIWLIFIEFTFIYTTIKSIIIDTKVEFNKDIKERKEEFFSPSFSLRKTFGILLLYFMIDFILKFQEFTPYGVLKNITILLFNPIVEGVCLSVFASCIFLVIQSINTLKNNFLAYQRIMYSLKNIFYIINNLELAEHLLLSEMHNINIVNCNFYKSDYLVEQVNYLENFKDFFINRLDRNDINLIIRDINQNEVDNIDISKKILSILDNMNALKKYPIKYIIDNY